MIFFFGWGRKHKVLGSAGAQGCSNCRNTAEWTVVMDYGYASLFFVPVARWGRRYYAVCPVCSYAEEFPDRPSAELALV